MVKLVDRGIDGNTETIIT